MVHQTRTSSKAIPAKHLSPMRSTDQMMTGKYAVSSSPVDSFLSSGARGSSSRLTVNMAAAAAAKSSSNATAYKYNNMVQNNREQFNAMHFC